MKKNICQKILVKPYTRPWIGGPDLNYIPDHARILHKGIPIDEWPRIGINENYKIIGGKCLYGGALYIHFGHIFQDTIIRLWGFDESVHDKIVFPLVGDKKIIPDYFYQIMKILKIPSERCYFLTEPSIFESLEFCEPGNQPHKKPSPEYIEWLSKLNFKPRLNGPKKIILGRKHILKNGSFMGESYFINLLLSNGFDYVKPENFDIQTQIEILLNADVIVFTEGSAIFPLTLLHNINASVFMLPRRQGGVSLFRSWIESRAIFNVLGSSLIIRKDNIKGKNAPNSPSYLLDPISTYQDLVKYGLIESVNFDHDFFVDCELNDTLNYFGQRKDIAIKQLYEIYSHKERVNLFSELTRDHVQNPTPATSIEARKLLALTA